MGDEIKSVAVDAFVASTNSDLTEGRGHEVIIAYCETPATARRFAKRRGVQGFDGDVSPVRLYIIEGRHYGPVRFERATDDDRAAMVAHDRRAELLAKARAAGLSDDDIKFLGAAP